MTADLIVKARTGDEEAFRELVEPFWRDLRLHCYRILGSMDDADDALQETLLAAWQGLGGFEERSSVRTWLYRIATTRSLNTVRSRSRRPAVRDSLAAAGLPEPTGELEVLWLEPYPGPEARYEASEAISLAFVTALQLLPPRQRAVLILRDVLGFHAGEVAQMLETTAESVTSALKRARATMHQQLHLPGDAEPAPAPLSPAERELTDRFTRAFEAADVDSVVALLVEDVRFAMPPLPFEWVGLERAGRFLELMWASIHFPPRLVATRANGQPAFAMYTRDPDGGGERARGLLVLTLAGDRISAITRFETDVARFGLPRQRG